MVLVLSRKDVESVLTMRDTIDAVEAGFRELASGSVKMPVRTAIRVEGPGGVFLTMPAYLGASQALGVKVVTVYPKNPGQHKLPTIIASLLLNNPETGAPVCLMDASFLTAMRTGAVTAVAAKYLARRDSKMVGLFGAGTQARTQLMAICAVRDVKRAKVYDVDTVRLEAFCREMAKATGIAVEPAKDSGATVKGSDVVITATTSKTPIFKGEWLEEGTFVSGIGSHSLDARELDEVTIKRSKLVVDQRDAALAEAGDIVTPIKDGVITEKHIYAELGEIVSGKKQGRTSKEEIILFKSCGLAVQDISTAKRVYELASKRNIGMTVAL
jgi:ornithine cyclodeaminase/alanine dehydrogenase